VQSDSSPTTLSIIIPFHNETGNAAPLLRETRQLFPQAEILAIDDGSTDQTALEIRSVPGITLLQHTTNLGQSAALWTGFQAARGNLIALLDGDGQNDPRDILLLLPQAGPGRLVCGVRARRADSTWRRLCGRLANAVRNSILHDGLTDAGCTLKILHRSDLTHFLYFHGFHRFLGPIARAAGLQIIQIPVSHRPRHHGHSHYSARSRLLRGLTDLFGVAWLLSRRYPSPPPPTPR
jgi:dolichol-phosphate mannosyltransferase